MVKTFEQFSKFSCGVQFFVPDDEAAYAEGKPCAGFGSVRYNEGSVYTGQLYFDGKNYNKLGFGRQDFMLSTIGALNEARGIRKAFFIGNYDYRKTEWIYGNGVLYYVNAKGKPAYFTKGFFEGLNKVGEYEGEFDFAMLAEGFTPAMEHDFDEWLDTLDRMASRVQNVKSLENLYIGDSYFELWTWEEYPDRLFYDVFDHATNLNIGVGGTRFCDWVRFIPRLKQIPQPKRILLNLGFNDIHSNFSAERVFEDYQKILAMLRERFPKAEYILNNVVKAPNFPDYEAEEEKFNAMTLAAADALKVKIVDMRSEIERAGGTENCFHEDNVHLNARGYKAYAALVKKIAENS